MSNWLINSMARGLFATAKLLYLYCTSHPYKHPSIASSDAPIPTGKHINRIHGIWIWNVFLEAL